MPIENKIKENEENFVEIEQPMQDEESSVDWEKLQSPSIRKI